MSIAGGEPWPGDAALERCVADAATFLAETWGRRPLLSDRRGPFDDLLSFEAVDHILSTMSLRLPSFRLVKDGTTLPSASYTKSGRTGSQPVSGIADPPRIFELFRQGATIVLQGMHRFWPPLARFCRDLELTLGHPTQVNAYITPPGSRGLAVHRDAHDVFVLQAFGSKHWDVWEPGLPVAEASAGRKPVLSAPLQPGDVLYLPVDTPHAARTQEVLSGHLTIGVVTTSWGELLRDVAQRIEREEPFAERLPAGFHRDPAAFAAAVSDRLDEVRRWLEKLDPSDVAGAQIRSFLTSRPPLSEGILITLPELDSIGDPAVVGRRPGSVCVLQRGGGRLVALLGDRELRMPVQLEDAMRFVGSRARFQVGDLAPLLDAESRRVLVRRLLREGLLEVVR
jgi:cupin superfamily protein